MWPVSERWAVALALCTAAGAALPNRLPIWLAATFAVLALARRRPALVCVGAALVASGLCERSWAGLHGPAAGMRVETLATIVTDPVQLDGAVKAELRLAGSGRRVEAWARGAPASDLRPRLAGERIEVTGRLSPVTGRRQAYLARRHIAARLIVADVGSWSRGGRLARLANDVRRTLVRGASSIPAEHRALFTGFILGDNRDQGPGMVDDFRAAGLSHLLAVSGQNVAFVLALAAPVLCWLGLRGRLVAGLCLLVGFGFVTRWEPSVLRAVAMAAIAMVASTMGRPASTVRVLALATTALLLIDPLLVGSVGFLLSCGACAGIAVLAAPIHARGLPLPLAVTLAAQIGVTPVLLPVFGAVPVASIPANLLAGPAAGPVMVWGLAAGLPAGLIGGPLATLVHLPTRLLVAWVAGVARWGANLPLGQLRAPHAIALVVLAAMYAFVAWSSRSSVHGAGWIGPGTPRSPRHLHPEGRPATQTTLLRTAVAAVAAAVVLWPAGPGGSPATADGRPVGGGAHLWSGDGRATVLVVTKARPGPLLADLRDARVRGLSVVVLPGTSGREEAALQPVLERHPARHVLTPATAQPGDAVVAGRLRIEVLAIEPRLKVRVVRL